MLSRFPLYAVLILRKNLCKNPPELYRGRRRMVKVPAAIMLAGSVCWLFESHLLLFTSNYCLHSCFKDRDFAVK